MANDSSPVTAPSTLAPWEKDMAVFRAICRAAEHGLRCPTADQLASVIGTDDGGAISTTVLVVNRLARRGMIEVRRFQRGREITVVHSGKQTAPARSRTPHWRERVVG